MQYGDWELRNDSVYYPSDNVILYPSSNSADEGSIHLESNVRSIVRRITMKSYKLHDNDFHVTLNSDGTSLKITAGEANIQGYHLITNKSLEIAIPVTAEITPYTLGIKLSYDAANNVTGDVVNYAGESGETFSGAFLKFFDECNIQHYYDSILVLARVWVKDGTIVSNTQIPADNPNNPYRGYYITNGIENDPVNDHAIAGRKVEVTVNGVNLNQYDAIAVIKKPATADGVIETVSNLSNVLRYDTMKYTIERNPQYYTKAPTFTTDLQDIMNYMPDWYVSKYGDYMTGGLRFDLLSYDAKRELDIANAIEYVKDRVYDVTGAASGLTGRYHGTAGILISPRTIGNLQRPLNEIIDETLIQEMYRDGGTIMTVVPQSYSDGIDAGMGDKAGIYAALVSQTDGDVGIRVRTNCGNTTRLVSQNHLNSATEWFVIEHSREIDQIMSSISFKESEIFIDCWEGGGVQIFVTPSIDATSPENLVATRFTPTGVQVNKHSAANPRVTAGGSATMHSPTSSTLIRYGVGVYLDRSDNRARVYTNTSDDYNPYIQVGNIAIAGTDVAGLLDSSRIQSLLSTIGLVNVPANVVRSGGIRDITDSSVVPYVNITPGMYSSRAVLEDYLVVGTSKANDLIGNEARRNTKVQTVIAKTLSGSDLSHYDSNDHVTYVAQTFEEDGEIRVYNWIGTPYTRSYDNAAEGDGIFSRGNIGATSAKSSIHSPVSGVDNRVYGSNDEWVRFTRYRYDKDIDSQYLGDAGIGTDGTVGTTGAEGNLPPYTHRRTLGRTYNIEFNTLVANQRANQIIWNYKGSSDAAHQPLTLSYIHDEITQYPNETYFDENLFRHQNPTYGVRDFLRIDGGGLSIHGDVNNPTLAGDASNEADRFGLTLVHGRVYSAAYNDYAETYTKADPDEQAVAGMVVMLDIDTGKYKICDEPECGLVVGVISDNYGMLIGGQIADTVEAQSDIVGQRSNFIIGVAGKVPVIVDGFVQPGDLLVSSDIRGHAKAADKANITPGTVIGKVLSKPYESRGNTMVMSQIMLS